MAITPIMLSQRKVSLHKAIFGTRNVLTNSPFTFVDLWLRTQKKEKRLASTANKLDTFARLPVVLVLQP